MRKFEVWGWYCYSNGDEKYFEKYIIISMSPEDTINIFKEMYKEVHFFKIHIKEIR